jgi:hypothetical protein
MGFYELLLQVGGKSHFILNISGSLAVLLTYTLVHQGVVGFWINYGVQSTLPATTKQWRESMLQSSEILY